MLFVMRVDKELVKNSHQHLGNEANATLRYFLTFLEAWAQLLEAWLALTSV